MNVQTSFLDYNNGDLPSYVLRSCSEGVISREHVQTIIKLARLARENPEYEFVEACLAAAMLTFAHTTERSSEPLNRYVVHIQRRARTILNAIPAAERFEFITRSPEALLRAAIYHLGD